MLRLGLAAIATAAIWSHGTTASPTGIQQQPTPACDHSLLHVCQGLEKKTDRVASLERRLESAYWADAPSPLSRTQFTVISRNALQAAEDSVYELLLLTRDSQRAELETAKAAVVGFLRAPANRALFAGPDGPQRLDRVVARIESVELRYGREWVESAAAQMHGGADGPERLAYRVEAWTQYHESCGRVGTRQDMFTSSMTSPAGGNVEGLVPCPGFVLTLADFAADRDDILPALQFYFGMQLGQILIEETEDLWSPDQQMTVCFGDGYVLDPAMQAAAGVTSDRPRVAHSLASFCWGGFTLGRRLAGIDSVAQRTRITALAMQPVCQSLAGTPPATRRWFIHQIGQVPALMAALPNAGPALDRPYCAG